MRSPQQTEPPPAAARGAVYGSRLIHRVGGRRVSSVGCGFSAEEAESAADSARRLLSTLGRESSRPPTAVPLDVPRERLLLRADFAPEPDIEEGGAMTLVEGALTGLRYAVPADVVLRTEPGGGPPTRRPAGAVHEAVHDAAGGLPAGRAVAQLLATDIAVRWWRRPRAPLLRLDAHRLLPEAVSPDGTSGLMTEGPGGRASPPARVAAFLWPALPFSLVLTVVHAESAGFGVAAGGRPREALRDALLLAHAARMSSARRPDATAHLTLLHDNSRTVRPGDLHDAPEASAAPRPDWIELAHRRFGHEPLIACFTAPDGGRVVRAVCPGAVVHRPFVQNSPECPL